MNQSRVLLIGATGATGRQVISVAGERGISLRALARNPSALEGTRVEVVRGDVLDEAGLAEAMRGIDTVVSVLGTRLILKGPVTLLSRGSANIVAAMAKAGVSRLIAVTGMGAGDSRGHGGFVYDHLILPALLGRIYADKDRQETIIRDSGLDWTIVRPAMLFDGPETVTWREITDWHGQKNMSRISRRDVAHFIIEECLASRYCRKVVNITY